VVRVCLSAQARSSGDVAGFHCRVQMPQGTLCSGWRIAAVDVSQAEIVLLTVQSGRDRLSCVFLCCASIAKSSGSELRVWHRFSRFGGYQSPIRAWRRRGCAAKLFCLLGRLGIGTIHRVTCLGLEGRAERCGVEGMAAPKSPLWIGCVSFLIMRKSLTVRRPPRHGHVFKIIRRLESSRGLWGVWASAGEPSLGLCRLLSFGVGGEAISVSEQRGGRSLFGSRRSLDYLRVFRCGACVTLHQPHGGAGDRFGVLPAGWLGGSQGLGAFFYRVSCRSLLRRSVAAALAIAESGRGLTCGCADLPLRKPVLSGVGFCCGARALHDWPVCVRSVR